MTLSQSNSLDTQLATLEAAIEYTEEELLQVWAKLARESYHDFYEYMVRDEGFVMSPHQRLIGDLLMSSASKETMRFLLSMPPGHCKSTHASHHFPAWWFGKNSKLKFLQAGHSQDFVANEIGIKVKQIIDSEDYRRVFPDVAIRQDMRAKDYWGLANGKGKYVAKGVGQGIAGFRGNYGMLDDPYKSRADAESPTIRDRAFKWFADDFSTRLLPGSPLGVIMTRWHSDDICGRIVERQAREANESANVDLIEQDAELLNKNKECQNTPKEVDQMLDTIQDFDPSLARHKFEVINLPAICEDSDDPLGRAIGEPLWPELFDLAALENLKSDMVASSWNSLYQGTPMDVEGGAVSQSWFRRYKELPSKGDASKALPSEIRRVVVSVDAANTAKERSDFTVITVWIEHVNKTHYLADVSRGQYEFVKMSEEIARMCSKWARICGKVDALLVEARGNGLSYCQLKAEGGAPAPLIPIEVGPQSKEFRFDEVTPMFEAGMVNLPERALWLADYEKELVAFPHGKHDDQVDSTSQYLRWSRKSRRRGTKRLQGTAQGR